MCDQPAALVGRHVLLLDSPPNRSFSVRRIDNGDSSRCRRLKRRRGVLPNQSAKGLTDALGIRRLYSSTRFGALDESGALVVGIVAVHGVICALRRNAFVEPREGAPLQTRFGAMAQ
jgi:hypothetical protein